MTSGIASRADEWRHADAESMLEIEGIAEGAGCAFEDVLALNCRGAFTAVRTDPQEGCTSFSVLPSASDTGHQIAGQNWDYLTGIQDTIVLVLMKPDQGPKQLLIVEAGQVGRHGYNESGLALHANGLSGGLQNRAAIPSPIWRRRILREWGVSEALDRALETPRPGTTNLMITHRDGFSVDFETTPSSAEALLPDEGWFVHTNHFLGPVPEPLQPNYRPGGDSLVRLGRARYLLGSASRNGGIGVQVLQEMLRDHVGDGRSLCAHPLDDDPPGDRWGTVASVITDMTAGTMLIAAGPPCEHEYSELDLTTVFG